MSSGHFHDEIVNQLLFLGRKLAAESMSLAETLTENDAERIHDLRVITKRLRALLRLLHPWLADKQQLKSAEQRLQIIGQLLGSQRDINVVLETIGELRMDIAPGLTDDLPVPPEMRLAADSETANRPAVPWDEVLMLLREENSFWNSLAVHEGIKRSNHLKTLKNTYRHARRTGHGAIATGDIVRFHRWRRWVKYLYYQLQLLNTISPLHMDKTLIRLNKLGNRLGRLHDLEMVEHYLGQQHEDGYYKLLVALQPAIDTRKSEHIAKAGRRYPGLFRDKPGKFSKNIERRLSASGKIPDS